MEERAWHGDKTPLLVTARQSRGIMRADPDSTVFIYKNEGRYYARVKAAGTEYQIANRDTTGPKAWASRARAVCYICDELGLPDDIVIEFKKNPEAKL